MSSPIITIQPDDKERITDALSEALESAATNRRALVTAIENDDLDRYHYDLFTHHVNKWDQKIRRLSDLIDLIDGADYLEVH